MEDYALRKVLTIAGSDCSGGAGIQADLKTMCAMGVYGMSVITAVTVQNTRAVYDVQEISPEIVGKQIDAIFEDIPVDAVKIGMVSNANIIRMIRDKLVQNSAKHIVVDPVMVSKSGYHLLRPEAVAAMSELIAIADIVTPNIPEAELLTGSVISSREDMARAAREIGGMGAKAVLVKGGHRTDDASDVLWTSRNTELYMGERIDTQNTHGTGCTLSAAIASQLALGRSTEAAVAAAKQYISQAIKDAFPVGGGVGPVGHLVQLYRQAGIRIEE